MGRGGGGYKEKVVSKYRCRVPALLSHTKRVLGGMRPLHPLALQGLAAIVHTNGNPHCHVILRGGSAGPNYSKEHVLQAEEECKAAGVPRRIMIDCSHGNSQKDHNRQPLVAADVGEQLAAGTRSIVGVMIESNLVEGNQKVHVPLYCLPPVTPMSHTV